MKKYTLDKEEQEILEAFEKGELVSVDNLEEEKARLREYATYTLQKRKNINIRLSQGDLSKLKSKAESNGLPYQTLISTLIHQYVNDKIKIEL